MVEERFNRVLKTYEYIKAGKKTGEISRLLKISPKTIETYKKEIEEDERYYSKELEIRTGKYEVESEVENDKIELECPRCKGIIKLKLSQLPAKGAKIGHYCENCYESMKIGFPNEMYACPGCNKSFDFLEERFSHQKTCEKIKENNCN